MKLLNILIVLGLAFQLSACATASISSQVAPDSSLSKTDPIYLEREAAPSIEHQKYIAALTRAIQGQGIHLVQSKASARYVMSVDFNDFAAKIVQSVPTTQTTFQDGHIGPYSISSTSMTLGSRQSVRQIPTHNSTIKVREKASGRLIWSVSVAKSYDVYSHKDLEALLVRMLSLYGKDGKAAEMMSDDMRL